MTVTQWLRAFIAPSRHAYPVRVAASGSRHVQPCALICRPGSQVSIAVGTQHIYRPDLAPLVRTLAGNQHDSRLNLVEDPQAQRDPAVIILQVNHLSVAQAARRRIVRMQNRERRTLPPAQPSNAGEGRVRLEI